MMYGPAPDNVRGNRSRRSLLQGQSVPLTAPPPTADLSPPACPPPKNPCPDGGRFDDIYFYTFTPW